MKKILTNPRFLFSVFVLLVLISTLQSYLIFPEHVSIKEHTRYNNFLIFKHSFLHLIDGKDLYAAYPNEHNDFYKYSPTFAMMMAPFAFLPNLIGLFFWNLLNVVILFFGIKKLQLPIFFQKKFGVEFSEKHAFILLFIALEMLTALQNEQSNAIMAGLIILAFVLLEKDKVWWATLCIALTFFIKVFGLVAFALFLVYPKKGKFILASATWMVVLGLAPVLIVGVEQLEFLYQSWWELLRADQSWPNGLSVMNWLATWFGVNVSKNVIVLLGVVLFCLPLLKIKNYSDYNFRWRLLCSILIWVVIFNHRAESPTFIIAMSGVGIWYFFSQKSRINLVLVVLAFIFTSFSPTDLFPRFLRESLVLPYVLKAVPCIWIWGKIVWEMWELNSNKSKKIATD